MISAGPITVDTWKREARAHGDLLLLTTDEFHLLAALALEPQREWAPIDLLDHIERADLGWLAWDVRTLAEKLTRVGIEHDLARTDGLYRLFKPEQGEDS